MQEDGSLVTLEEKTHWWISNPSKGLHVVLFTGQTFPPSEQRDSSKNKDHLELRDFQFPSPGAVFNLQFSISCIIDRERRGWVVQLSALQDGMVGSGTVQYTSISASKSKNQSLFSAVYM